MASVCSSVLLTCVVMNLQFVCASSISYDVLYDFGGLVDIMNVYQLKIVGVSVKEVTL